MFAPNLKDRIDELFSRARNQLQSDQHQLVENEPDITDSHINSYVLKTPPTERSNKLLRTLSSAKTLKVSVYHRGFS